MIISILKIQDDLMAEPLRPITDLPDDPFEAFSRTLFCFLPPSHVDLIFLVTLYAAAHYKIIRMRDIFKQWTTKRTSLTKDNPDWDILPSAINLYLPLLPAPKLLQPAITLLNAFKYRRKPVDLPTFFEQIAQRAFRSESAFSVLEHQVLIHVCQHPTGTLSEYSSSLGMPEHQIGAILRQLRKRNLVSLYLRMECQTIGLDELIVYIHNPNVRISSSFPVHSIPYFGKGPGTVLTLRVPKGQDSIWIQRSLVSFARQIKCDIKIYRVINYEHIFHPEYFDPETQSWSNATGFDYDSLPKSEWIPPYPDRQIISKMDYFFLMKNALGLPLGGNRDPNHPFITALRQEGLSISERSTLRIANSLIKRKICSAHVIAQRTSLDYVHEHILFEGCTREDISRLTTWCSKFPFANVFILESAWPGTTLDRYAFLARIKMAGDELPNLFNDLSRKTRPFLYTSMIRQTPPIPFSLPLEAFFNFDTQQWLFKRDDFKIMSS